MTVTNTKRKNVPGNEDKANFEDEAEIRYSCDYCFRDISSLVRIQCAECGLEEGRTGAEEVDLCAECFAAGVEFSTHKKNHSYRILQPLGFAVFDKNWRADEEMLLLEAVESNGLGNWADIADQIGGGRTVEECRDHYLRFYMPCPFIDGTDELKLMLSDEEVKQSFVSFSRTKKEGIKPTKRTRIENTKDEVIKTLQSVPANHEITGFMPLRGEFECEIENEAEINVKDMQFAEGIEEDPREELLKYTILDIYSSVLDRRSARRAFVISHGLVDFKKHQQADKSRTKEEKDLYSHLKPYARFMTPSNLQRMLDGLVREAELRRQISHLQELRVHGIRSFEEVPSFEAEKRHLELYLKGGVVSYAGPSSSSTNAFARKEPHPLPPVRPSSVVLKEPIPTNSGKPVASNLLMMAQGSASGDLEKTYDDADIPGSNQPTILPILNAAPLPSPSPSPYISPSATPPTNGFCPNDLTAGGNVYGIGGGSCNSSGISQPIVSMSNGGRKASTPLNISHADGVELLSEKERHLCSILRLYPRLYLNIKDTLIREYLKIGGLKRAQARAAVKIDVNKTSKLYDFFIAAGWIHPPSSGE